MIRILLIGESRLLRDEPIRSVIREDDMSVVGELEFSPDASDSARKCSPSVVVFNTDYMIGQVLPVASRLVAEAPGCSLLILTENGKPGMLPPRRRTPRVSVLLRDSTARTVAATIRRLADGQSIVDPRLLVATLTSSRLLNVQELQVLGLAAEGVSVSLIADRLYLAPGTVRNYMSAVIRKTGARDLTDAVQISRSKGWLR